MVDSKQVKDNPNVGKLNDPKADSTRSNGKGAKASAEKEVRIIFQEAGLEGLDIYSGFITEAYHSKLYWPTVEPLYSRLRRSMPEVVMVRTAFTSWARRVGLTVELPDEPSDDDKKYQEFVESVFDDVEGGATKLLDTMVNHVPFMGWALWEAIPGRRSPDWKPPKRTAPNGDSYPDDWRSEYDDDLIGFRRFGFRAHNSFKEWIEQTSIKNVIGMRQMVDGQPDVDLLFKDCLHLTYGDPTNPEGLSPLEAVWRLERIRYGLEVIQGIGFEHSAGYFEVQKTQSGALGKSAKEDIKRAARAVLTAKEGNYAYLPHGLEGTIRDINFQAAGSLLEAIKHYSILSLSVYLMQWMALNTMTGTGSFAAMDDSSTMGVTTFNSMLDGFAAQIDEQIGKKLWTWNSTAFPGLTKRPKIKITHIEKSVALADMGAFAVQVSNIMPLDEEDFKAIRERSGFLPTTVPQVDEAKEKETPFSDKDEEDEEDEEESKDKDEKESKDKGKKESESKNKKKGDDKKDKADLATKEQSLFLKALRYARSFWPPKADLHYGPGPHKSGSPQSAHGGGRAEEYTGAPGQNNSMDDNRTESGGFTDERQKLHAQIVDSFFEGKTPVSNPEAVIMGGGPASGKSWLIRSGMVKTNENSVVVNSDDIKTMLPEYGERGAAYVHEESSYLSKEVARRAGEESYNTVFDGTGDNSLESLERKVDLLTPDNRPVYGYYVTIPTDEAIRRSDLRAKKSGRSVPKSVVRITHAGVSNVLPQAVEAGLFDKIELYNNMVPQGEPPVLIMSGGKGLETQIQDPAAYQDFLDKVGTK